MTSGWLGPSGGTERVRPSEPGAKMFCGGTPCDSVEVSYSRSPGHNGWVYGLGLLAEGVVGGVLTQDESFNLDDPNTLTYVSAGLLTTAALDLIFWAIDDDFWGGHLNGATLKQPATVTLDGKTASLDVSDIVNVSATDKMPTQFLASTAIDRQIKEALEAQRQKEAAKRAPPAVAAAPVPAPSQAPAGGRKVQKIGKLAVLELKNSAKELSADNVRYFTDVVRQGALRFAPQYDVMTRENLLVLLQSTGRSLSDCEGECEVDTGRRIGADAIISGDIQKVGTRLKLSIKLHETHEGKLLGSAIGSGRTVDELDDGAQAATRELLTTP